MMKLSTVMTIKNIGLLFLLVFLLPVLSHSQTSDAKLWLGVSLEKKLNKKFNASIDLEQRFYNNVSSIDRFLLEPSLSYKLSKRWSLNLKYRIWKRQTVEQYYELHQRTSMGLSYKKKLHGINFRITGRLQYGMPDNYENNYYVSKRLLTRNSMKASYKIFGTRYTPFCKYELFTSLKRLDFLNYQWRLAGGSSIYINDDIDLQVYYIYENEYNVLNPVSSHIWGFSLNYKL